MFHITWYDFHGRVQSLCLTKGRLGRWLACSCAPAVTMHTTGQSSKCRALSWDFQGNWSSYCFAWKHLMIKCRNPRATSGAAGLSVEEGQKHSWGWESLCTLFLLIIQSLWKRLCWGKQYTLELKCVLWKSEMYAWTHRFNSLLPLRKPFGISWKL